MCIILKLEENDIVLWSEHLSTRINTIGGKYRNMKYISDVMETSRKLIEPTPKAVIWSLSRFGPASRPRTGRNHERNILQVGPYGCKYAVCDIWA